MAQRHQQGHLRRAKRKRGPDVREFLWRESGKDGRRRQRTLTIGNVKEFRTEWDALNHIQSLKTNINKKRELSALMKLKDLVNHYRQTELLAENKTERPEQRIWCTYENGCYLLGNASTCTTSRLSMLRGGSVP